MKKCKVGMVGFGSRGLSLMKEVLLGIETAEFTAVCDSYEDRAVEAADLIEEKRGKRPAVFTDYEELLACEEVDTVLITSAWETHIPFAIKAMRAGKATGMEVGGAYSIQQCWDLVRTYEETGTKIMMLENCCYGRREMMALHMAELGVLGQIVHCAGGYHHDLREEVGFGKENRHYRLRNYIHRNCENYPTHELGPIARVLGINRGNKMLTLSATASKAAGLHEYIEQVKPEDTELRNTVFAQGDIVTTVIKCAGGETITMTLDTTLPRYYSRGFTVRGTKGMYEEVTDSVFLDDQHKEFDFNWKPCWGNAKEYEEQYDHPVWKNYLSKGVVGTHDGMDWLVFNAFFDSVVNEEPCPIDVYDGAAWMCIASLTEQSIAMGGHPVEVPDFTNGRWQL